MNCFEKLTAKKEKHAKYQLLEIPIAGNTNCWNCMDCMDCVVCLDCMDCMNLDIIGDEYDLEEITDYARDAIVATARQTWLEYEEWRSEMNSPAFKQLNAIEQELRVTKFTLNAICNALNVRIHDKQLKEQIKQASTLTTAQQAGVPKS